mmetsp:Transcript_34434/g.31129  ORF Transcript_34434/g.31129 Transcript_34434/m.31129 type:complete len:88 (+) Transcript_34434:560-823(+)
MGDTVNIDDYGYTFVDYKQDRDKKVKVFISLKSLLMMNLHSHITKNEVIGLMGGKLIGDKLIIEEAAACRNVAEITTGHSVEMDATA